MCESVWYRYCDQSGVTYYRGELRCLSGWRWDVRWSISWEFTRSVLIKVVYTCTILDNHLGAPTGGERAIHYFALRIIDCHAILPYSAAIDRNWTCSGRLSACSWMRSDISDNAPRPDPLFRISFHKCMAETANKHLLVKRFYIVHIN